MKIINLPKTSIKESVKILQKHLVDSKKDKVLIEIPEGMSGKTLKKIIRTLRMVNLQ